MPKATKTTKTPSTTKKLPATPISQSQLSQRLHGTHSHRTPKGHRLGWKPELPMQEDKQRLFRLVHPTTIALPPKVSLRSKYSYVFDQADTSSCTGNAIAVNYGALRGVNSLADAYSRFFIYWNERYVEGTTGTDDGAEIRDGIKSLYSLGVCQEKMWPFVANELTVEPNKEAFAQALNNKITSYTRLETAFDFKQCLAQGHGFTIGFTVYESIDSDVLARTGLMTMPGKDEKAVGGHAIAVIGYDDDFFNNPVFQRSGLAKTGYSSKVYEIQNSWGDWGDNGRFWMPAAYLEDRSLSDDAWSFRI